VKWYSAQFYGMDLYDEAAEIDFSRISSSINRSTIIPLILPQAFFSSGRTEYRQKI